MSDLSIHHQATGVFLIDGALTFSAINDKTASLLKLTDTSGAIVIDLHGVASADSAGLALMIEWIKQAQKKRIALIFKNIPKQLMTLAKLSGLENNPYFSADTQPA